jgi:hypothetical protein
MSGILYPEGEKKFQESARAAENLSKYGEDVEAVYDYSQGGELFMGRLTCEFCREVTIIPEKTELSDIRCGNCGGVPTPTPTEGPGGK